MMESVMLSTPGRKFVAVALCHLVCANSALAVAHITWSSPSTIAGDTDVSTAGSLVYAYNIGGPLVNSATINGVTFSAFPIVDGGTSTTSGSLTVKGFSDEPMSTAGGTGSGSAPFASLSANYQSMLGDAVQKSSGTIHFLDMNLLNLTVGQTYTLQVWTNNSNPVTTSASLWDFFGDHVQNIDINTTNAIGGVGQYLFGTFTADDTTEPFFIHGESFPDGVAVLNGLQLRAEVPEPGTIGLVAWTAILLLQGRAKRRNSI
jgi:hypothetical protein